MNYNAVISVEDVTDESGSIAEPVTLQEIKDYLRLEGYIDTDASTSDNLSFFTFDDNLLTDLIKASRQAIEEHAGISIVRKTIQAVITNLCGMIEIPAGPIVSITTLKNENGDLIASTDYKVVGSPGNSWKFLKSPCQKHLTIYYEAGYVKLPKPLKIDIMRLTAYMYEHRGDDPAIGLFVSQLASKYSRNTWIV